MSTQRTILELNDDCFYQIYEFLPIMDWCSLRDTCTRLRTISDFCFERRSKTFQLREIFMRLPRDSAQGSSDYNLNFSRTKRVIRSFGGLMKTVILDRYYFDQQLYCGQLVQFLNRYCQSLRVLTLVNIKLPLMANEQRSGLFSNLHRLMVHIENDDETFSSYLAQCTSLTELRIVGAGQCIENGLAHIRLECLKSFQCYFNYDKRMNYESIRSFFTLNRQLTQVGLNHLLFRDGCNAHSILEDLARTLPKLEDLSINFYEAFKPDILPVITMTSLKRLEIGLEYVSEEDVRLVLSGVALHKCIEDLHLVQFKCTDESIRLLSALKTLKILKFNLTNRLDGRFCKALASELVALEEIHIYECTDTSFNDIQEFVEKIPTIKRIVFNCPEHRWPSIVPEVFISLVEIKKRQTTNQILSIYVNGSDLRSIKYQFESTGMGGTIAAHANVVKVLLLDLDKGHRWTASKYGNTFICPVCCQYYSDMTWETDLCFR